MVRTFKLRYVNEIVGFFVLLCVGLLVVGIIAALRGKQWFEPAAHITVDLPPEGSLGLKPGSTVYILGSDVGAVESINYENGRMTAVITVRGKIIELVRVYSYAMITKSFGIGETYMTIERDDPYWQDEPPLPPDRHMQAFSDTGATDRISQILTQVQEQVVPAVKRVNSILAKVDGQTMPALNQSVAHLNAVADRVERGQGLVGKLLNDPQFAQQIDIMLPKINASLDETQGLLKDLRKTSGNLTEITSSAQKSVDKLPDLLKSTQGTMDEVQGALHDVRKATVRMPEIVEGVNQTVQALPGTVLQMQETMRQIQILVEGFQKSWIVRSHIEQNQPTGRIRPEEIGGMK
jgi:phospholipid/cholesterol/gamma-HCH transport system substrate-binding protein